MVIGFVVWPGVGEKIGLVLAFFYFVFFLIFGERLVLSFLAAKHPHTDKKLLNNFQNISHLLKIDKVEVYLSEKWPYSFFAIKGFGSRRSIVLGTKVSNLLSDKETQALLEHGLKYFKTSVVGNVALINLLMSPFTLVVIISEHLWGRSRGMTVVIAFLIQPFIALRDSFIRHLYNTRQQGIKKMNNDPVFIGARLKLFLHSKELREGDAFENFLSNYSLIKNNEDTINEHHINIASKLKV